VFEKREQVMMIEISKIELIAPTMFKLIQQGVIYVRDGEFFGKASDGVEVTFGDSWNLTNAERYLRANPTPDKW
jgi:hypothetical protein